MERELLVGGTAVAPGTKKLHKYRVCTDLNGSDINLWVHALAGKRPGPTLTLTSTLHGGEWLTIEFMRRLHGLLDPAGLTGNVIMIPVANPVAFCNLERTTPQAECDSPDLNRSFPGQWDTIAEQIARLITTSVLNQTDYLIDYHGGMWASIMGDVSYGTDYPEPVRTRARQIACAFGYPMIQAGSTIGDFPGPKSIKGYSAANMDVAAIGVEIGGAGVDDALEEQYLNRLITGTLSVMRYLGMIPGQPTLCDRYLLFSKRHRVHPKNGGYLKPVLLPGEQLKEVAEDELLGLVYSPYTFELIEELRAPCHGVAFYVARSYPVRPGDWAYGLADLTHEETRWMTPAQLL